MSRGVKLNDPKTSAKAYWSILKTLYNGKKIPLIPQMLVNKKLISNFKEKSNHFNAFFASQCTSVSNDSALPSTTNSVSNVNVQFKEQDILKVIRSLNYNEAHGYDDISTRLLKICDSAIVKPLSVIVSKIVYKLGLFLVTGKSLMLYLFIKEVTSNSCKIIAQFRCCQ